MGLRTAQQYRESLRDGRIVYYKGEKIEDVTTHPDLSVGTNTMAVDFELAENPKYRSLAVIDDPEFGPISRYYYIPKNAEDLLKAHELIITSTTLSDGFIPFSHDIGADVLNAIAITANAMGNKEYIERITNYGKYLKQNDPSLCAAVTDAKGDRSLRPSDSRQTHPDFNLRVVKKDSRGIFVRGAKVHITGAAYCNELFVIPCRSMTEADKDYAVAFAIPTNTKGITQVCRPFKSHITPLEFPNSRPVRIHTDSFIIFDDVFVPWERVFLCGEWRSVATLVYNFALLHRRTGCSYRVPMSEQLVGVAAAIAEYNGVANAPHVKEKMTDLAIYLETLKALCKAACHDFVSYSGIAVPNPVITNIAKYHFAHNYHDVVKTVQDLAGGLVITAPTYKDWQLPELRDKIEKYLGGKAGIPTENRLRMLDLIRRIAAEDREIIALHGEGSPYAERMTIYFETQSVIAECKKLAEELAEIKK